MTDPMQDEPVKKSEFSFQHRTPKTWNKVVIDLDASMTDAVGAFLAELTGIGIQISSAQINTGPDKDNRINFEKITAYIPVNPAGPDTHEKNRINELNQFLAKLSHIFPDSPPPRLNTEMIQEEDWGKAWKSFFSAFQITPRLTIKPSWEDTGDVNQGAGEEKLTIVMDPGLAFGTGHHASTRLALLLLEELFFDNKHRLNDILDIGTGSGILAMGCGLYGAQKILAIDNDLDAVETAKNNVIRNRLENLVTVSDQDIATISPGFDLIVANITHDTLADMAKVITGILNPEGFLVLSGILKGEQENSIRDIFTEQGLLFIKVVTEDEWAALQFQKINNK